MQQVSVGLGLHRPEMIPMMSEAMRRHDAVFLEEPPAPGFDRMIRGKLSVDDYLLTIDVEYPRFNREMCRLLRELHAEGKKLHQVEPFIESLVHIHEFFADGRRPDDLSRDSIHFHVYRAERAATGALLAYYQTVAAGSFENSIEAVIRFARADAARFRLRDSLRAQALASLIHEHPSSYVEAGLIHYHLWRLLRERLRARARVQPVFLADAALQALGESGPIFGPGDQLTLLYIFHPAISQPEAAARLRKGQAISGVPSRSTQVFAREGFGSCVSLTMIRPRLAGGLEICRSSAWTSCSRRSRRCVCAWQSSQCRPATPSLWWTS